MDNDNIIIFPLCNQELPNEEFEDDLEFFDTQTEQLMTIDAFIDCYMVDLLKELEDHESFNTDDPRLAADIGVATLLFKAALARNAGIDSNLHDVIDDILAQLNTFNQPQNS